MEIKVSGAAGVCARAGGDSAANDDSVQRDLKVEPKLGSQMRSWKRQVLKCV